MAKKRDLKGNDFSRAEKTLIFTPALAAEGRFGDFKTFPRGLKPRALEALVRHD
jgi:hypothetical protein